MKTTAFRLAVGLLVLPVIHIACIGDRGTPTSMPEVVDVRALSSHYVLVTLAAPAGSAVEDLSNFLITEPGAGQLPVLSAELSDDGTRVLLATEGQQDVSYSFTLGGAGEGDGMPFLGSVRREPFLESAIALSNTQILLTFSTKLDRTSAENAAYYRIKDPDGDTDVDIEILSAALSDDGTTVVLITTAQENMPYEIGVTNVQASYTCADGAVFLLDVLSQGPLCDSSVRPRGIDSAAAQFRVTARTDVNHNQSTSALADGSAGSVTTSGEGAGVMRTSCSGSPSISGSSESRDEELVFTPDEPVLATDIRLGLRQIDLSSDEPVLFISSVNAPDYDYVVDADEIRPAFSSTGGHRGEIDFAMLGSLPQGLMINMFKIRATREAFFVETVCGLEHRGQLIDPTRNTASLFGMPPVDGDGPEVTNVVSTGDTTLLVSFNEPLSADAINPASFGITPALTVVDAALTLHDTQVILTTLPQVAGQQYTVTVVGVTDKAGNAIEVGAGDTATFTFSGGAAGLGAGTLPRVVGAASSTNTEVIVTFNKPMGDSAVVASNYAVVTQSVQAEAAGLIVSAADWLDQNDRTAVKLTTWEQSQIEYVVVAFNVRDQSGNLLAPRTPLVDPTSASFWGTGVSGEPADFDNDGLPDVEEQLGWIVTITLKSGEVIQREVTSDPTKSDTDEDGLDDREEQRRGTDPRDQDTDADLLADNDEALKYLSSPTAQDSDEDGIDDAKEISVFDTSPILDDTDGDGLLDGDEVLVANRHPRIADLPRPRVDIGEMNLTLDTRFSFTDAMGQSQTTDQQVSTSLTQSETDTFGFSDSNTTAHAITTGGKFGMEFPVIKAGFEVSFGFNYSDSETVAITRGSAQSAQESYQESLGTSATVDETRSVTREVVGANVQVNLSIENQGDIAFSIANLQVSALQQDPRNRGRLVPVATLSPAVGTEAVFNLGPFVPERGPFIFESREVFPSLVEDLFKNPRGLVFKVANFDLTDELGRNFAFASQTTNDRTAGLVLDFGNGVTESYRVATNSTFDDDSIPVGITMREALQEILDLPKLCAPGDNNAPMDCAACEASCPDRAIVDGGDGVADTVAHPNDIQVIPVGLFVGADRIVVLPGADGQLQTIPVSDDRVGLTAGYTTEITNGVEYLTRVRSIEEDSGRQQFWRIIANRPLSTDVNFDDIVLNSGDVFSLALVQDQDDDNLWAREEFLHRSSDLLRNSDGHVVIDGGDGKVDTQATGDDIQLVVFGNQVTPFTPLIGPGANGVIEPATQAGLAGDDRFLDPANGTGDLLQDTAEVRDGWIVAVVGQLPYRVYSDPSIADSDGDGLADDDEFNRLTDPRKIDTDDDRVSDADEVNGYGPGNMFQTDPLNPDSDNDGLTDGVEIALGANPNVNDSATFLDTDNDGLTDLQECLCGSDRLVADSDGDQLPDLLECFPLPDIPSCGPVPANVFDQCPPPPSVFVCNTPDLDGDNMPDPRLSDPNSPNSDADSLLDFDEFDPQSPQSISPSLFNQFNQACSQAANCFYSSTGSQLYGTDPRSADTDGDMRDDDVEVNSSWLVLACINGAPPTSTLVQSSPRLKDADNDGSDDMKEFNDLTHPNQPDTDMDSILDGSDAIPDGCSKKVRVEFDRYVVGNNDCDPAPGGLMKGTFTVRLFVDNPDDAVTPDAVAVGPFCLYENEVYYGGGQSSLEITIKPGQSLEVSGEVIEYDNFGSAVFDCTACGGIPNEDGPGDCDDAAIGDNLSWNILPREFTFAELSSGLVDIDPINDPAASCFKGGNDPMGDHQIVIDLHVIK